MSELFKLSDRPKWWVPRVLMWVTFLGLFLSGIFLIASSAFGLIDTMALNGTGDVTLSLWSFAEEALWTAIALSSYAFIFWLLSLAVDKIDQLVWLNASDEDRAEIIQKRARKRKS